MVLCGHREEIIWIKVHTLRSVLKYISVFISLLSSLDLLTSYPYSSNLQLLCHLSALVHLLFVLSLPPFVCCLTVSHPVQIAGEENGKREP